MNTYEEVLTDIAALPSGVAGNNRDIRWLTQANVIGVARDPLGRLEVFLAGPQLTPRTATLKSAIEFHAWHRAQGQPLSATRLLLPAFGHFDHVGAFICTELLREGAERDIERAFAVTEPIIELAIERLQLSEAALVGLAGELLLLDAVSRKAVDHQVAQVVQAWDGWRRSARDFTWDRTGLEVKTTTRATSHHTIQGLHQIEAADGSDGGTREERLLLVSIGLQQSDQTSNSFTIPMLVQRIVDRLEATGSHGEVDAFIDRVATYGSESGFGYNHTTMSTDAPFTTSFTTAFVRGYDMADPRIEVLRRDDVSTHHHVDAQSVAFRINLPATVSANNPVVGANRVAGVVLGMTN